MPRALKHFLRLTPAQFMRRHWQKKPLLVRDALPQYAALADPGAVLRLAQRDDVQSRLVMRHEGKWQVRHGPFSRAALRGLPRCGYALLVQGVDRVLPLASELLGEFRFLPHARLDDVMMSYAPPGGGVGPHFDSYDVFLLQGGGTRRWRIGAQRDLELVPGAPLRILRRFVPDREWTVGPGDLLYLPPRFAHDGVALQDCVTISIGFRAPSAAELTARFLEHLQDTLQPEGRYADPELAPVAHPGRIGADMIRKFAGMLGAIRWTEADVVEFAGRYLTEPKPHVVFERAAKPLAPSRFADAASRRGVRLSLKTTMLFHDRTFFVNGESHRVTGAAAGPLRRLADRRLLRPPLACTTECVALLHEWYRAGYVVIGTEQRNA